MEPETLASLTERGLIARLRPRLATRPDVLVGAGDDCALVRPPAPGEVLVLKSDPVICGRHFLPDTEPRRIGHKALGRVLSDFAAMGAEPRWGLIDFSAPPDTPAETAEQIYEGIHALAERYGVAIAGGDTTAADTLSLHVFVAGAVPEGKALLRSAAEPGDSLYVTGLLGRSYESGHHLDFEPRLKEGRFLASHRFASAMLDISDGLLLDASRLAAASQVALTVEKERIPLRAGAEPDTAWSDGEDYELLFTVPGGSAARLEEIWPAGFAPITRIGFVSAGSGEVLAPGGKSLIEHRKSGYEH